MNTEVRPVLYAEDEDDDAFFMQRAFKQAEITNPLIIVPDGQEAIDYLLGTGKYANRKDYRSPGLILLDLNLPKLTGVEVLKQIRSQPSTAALPVLIFTSSIADSDMKNALANAASGYLVKPSQPDQLLPLVKSIKENWLTINRRS